MRCPKYVLIGVLAMIVIPVYRKIVTPDAILYFQVEQLNRASGGKGVSVNEKIVIVVAKDKESAIELKEDGFYPSSFVPA